MTQFLYKSDWVNLFIKNSGYMKPSDWNNSPVYDGLKSRLIMQDWIYIASQWLLFLKILFLTQFVNELK